MRDDERASPRGAVPRKPAGLESSLPSTGGALATLLEQLREEVRRAVRAGVDDALASRPEGPQEAPQRLVDKRSLAQALAVSPATIDRLCRDGRIPFVRVGDVRRFDPLAVRQALGEAKASAPGEPATRSPLVPLTGVRLLSRAGR
jgi:excisionase family DNA binding protein